MPHLYPNGAVRTEFNVASAQASPDGAGERAITSHRDSVLNWKLGLDFWGKRLLDYSSSTSHLHFDLRAVLSAFYNQLSTASTLDILYTIYAPLDPSRTPRYTTYSVLSQHLHQLIYPTSHSIMADASCSGGTPFKRLIDHQARDVSHHQDRLVDRAGPQGHSVSTHVSTRDL